MNIYDQDGQPRDLAWLTNKFGPVIIQAGGRYAVTEVHERSGDACIVVNVRDASGNPALVNVAFSWPDAPSDPAAGHLGRAIVGPTNANGDVGFAMGSGGFYFPPNQGPHSVWIYGGDSDLVRGLGMLGATDHLHLNV